MNTPSYPIRPPEFVQPKKGVVVLAVVLVALGFGLSFAWDAWAVPSLKAWLASAESRADLQNRLATIIAGILVAVVAFSVALATWVWVLSVRMYRHSVFPPVGYPVVVKTVVLRGPAAVRQAWLHAAVGALCLALCAFVVGSLFSIFPLAQLFWGAGG